VAKIKEKDGEFEVWRDPSLFLVVFLIGVPFFYLLTLALVALALKVSVKSFILAFTCGGLHFYLWQKFNWFYESGYFWYSKNLWPDIGYYFTGLLGLSSLAAFVASWVITRPPAKVRHVAGPRFEEDVKKSLRAAAQQIKGEIRLSGKGLKIHPEITLSLDRETKHFLIVGSTGGGKTTAINPLIEAAQERKDKIIVYDNKQEITEKFQGFIMAPWDARSCAWAVGKDVLNRADAETLAARLIPEGGNDPMWALGARQILVALFVQAQREKTLEWDFETIIESFIVSPKKLFMTIKNYNPLAMKQVEDLMDDLGPGRTTTSFMVQIAAYLGPVQMMAEGWSGQTPFSFREWLLENKEFKSNTLILQGSKRFETLSKMYIKCIIDCLKGVIDSPEMGNDSKKNRVWLFLDELPQLGKIESISTFLEIGRSRGVRVVIGVQDIAQLEEIYGEKMVKSWSSMIGTSIICQTMGNESPKWLSEYMKNRIVERLQVTNQPGQAGNDSTNRTLSYQRAEEPVVHPNYISSGQLGPWSCWYAPWRKGVRSVLNLNKSDVLRVLWPFWSRPDIRPAVVMREESSDLANKVRAAMEVMDEPFEISAEIVPAAQAALAVEVAALPEPPVPEAVDLAPDFPEPEPVEAQKPEATPVEIEQDPVEEPAAEPEKAVFGLDLGL
jgi:Type IV secretory pathway, VirD4 components